MMEALWKRLSGSDVNVPDAAFAWMLDGRGGVKPLENTDD